MLSPFDRLIHDRVRPWSCSTSNTRWRCTSRRTSDAGTSCSSVLHHDRLVGKVDVLAERKTSVLQVNAVHQDVRFTRAMTAAVTAELQALAEWLRLADVRYV